MWVIYSFEMQKRKKKKKKTISFVRRKHGITFSKQLMLQDCCLFDFYERVQQFAWLLRIRNDSFVLSAKQIFADVDISND